MPISKAFGLASSQICTNKNYLAAVATRPYDTLSQWLTTAKPLTKLTQDIPESALKPPAPLSANAGPGWTRMVPQRTSTPPPPDPIAVAPLAPRLLPLIPSTSCPPAAPGFLPFTNGIFWRVWYLRIPGCTHHPVQKSSARLPHQAPLQQSRPQPQRVEDAFDLRSKVSL